MHQQLTLKTASDTIHCATCEDRISTALGALPGITSVRASAKTQEIKVRFDSAQSSAEEISAKLTDIGFPAAPVEEGTR